MCRLRLGLLTTVLLVALSPQPIRPSALFFSMMKLNETQSKINRVKVWATIRLFHWAKTKQKLNKMLSESAHSIAAALFFFACKFIVKREWLNLGAIESGSDWSSVVVVWKKSKVAPVCVRSIDPASSQLAPFPRYRNTFRPPPSRPRPQPSPLS